ncbi:MAG: Crp/Fnr family transcriptional regulator [Burkholderiales bacterium]|nr:Crp/Fnr family transcriptional regulator [Burkholderiales bacterium]
MPPPIDLPAPLQQLLPAALLGQCTTRRVARDTRLFHQRQRPRAMHFVAHGEVLLQRPGEQGSALVLQRIRQGLVAEASLQAGAYHCDAVVAVPAEIVSLPIGPLREALAADPAFAMRWIGMLNAELRRQRMQCERLSIKGVRERVLHLLATEGSAGRLAVPAGLKSLATELAVTHEALYRTLAALAREGRVTREPGALLLRTPR